MKIWVDDLRLPPDGYVWVRSVNEAIALFLKLSREGKTVEVLDLDHDSGDYFSDGGDYICLLDYLERGECPLVPSAFRFHSMNPVGVANMRRIINRNGWIEVF